MRPELANGGKQVNRGRQLIAALSVTVVSVFASVLPATAATAVPAGQGIEISPPLVEKSVDPGQTITFDIRLRNITTSSLITTGTVEDFVAAGEDGRPKLLLDAKAEPSPYSFRPWVKDIPRLSLVSQEAKVATITIAVPKDASPGGHYGVIRFSATPPELEGTGVSLSASIGTLVLLNVSGNVVSKASIAELYALQNERKSSFFEKGPIVLGIRIKNEGNVHIKPTGTLRVTGTFGNEVAVLPFNPNGGNILPQSIRRFEQQIKQTSLFGRYSVKADVQYNGQVMTKTMSFWVIPYKPIAIVLGLLILLVAASRVGIKKYNRYIISKANSSKHKK